MRKWLPLWVLVAGPVLLPTATAADNTAPEGFVPLFNGKDLAGWQVPEGDHGHWRVVDGAIDYDAQSEAAGDKALWTEGEYRDFTLQVDWRLKEAPYLNRNVPYILPDGTHARDLHGQEIRMAMPDADSGIYLRGSGQFQVNIWCWPIGSGEMYGVRTDPQRPASLRAAVTPRTQADRPVGEWNHFEITVRDKTVKVILNGVTVIPGATIPDLPARGRLALQHHGGKDRSGAWMGPPSLVQFKNIYIQALSDRDPSARGGSQDGSRPGAGVIRGLVITGGHEHDIAFYSLFSGYPELARLPVMTGDQAFRNDLRSQYDVLILYDFARDLSPNGKQNLRAFVEGGKGIVVLHHALLDYPDWAWWAEEVVGGRYRLGRQGTIPSSTVKNDQPIDVQPVAEHPMLTGIHPFHVVDETYKGMYFSTRIRPLLTTNNPQSDPVVAWIGPCATSRVVAIQLGHGPTIFANPDYRALVHNAILWSARRLP